jgi:hypothetical protein
VVPSTNRIKNRTTALRAAGPGELVTWLKDGIGHICRSAINRSGISGLLCALAKVRPVPPDTACPTRFRIAPGWHLYSHSRLQLTYAGK